MYTVKGGFVPCNLPGYVDYLLGRVDAFNPDYERWLNVLVYLHGVRFEYILDRDANRVAYAKDLRRRATGEVTNEEASVLEVLISVSEEAGNELIGEYGVDKTPYVFWMMIANLGLLVDGLTEETANYILAKWMYREFEFNGLGSPFPIQNCHRDQRKVDLWLQICGYFSSQIERVYV